MGLRKILVANRGEIAVRIIRAARDLGIRTVQAVSAADGAMLAARMADEVVQIGPAPAARSYLNREALVAAALTLVQLAIVSGLLWATSLTESRTRVHQPVVASSEAARRPRTRGERAFVAVAGPLLTTTPRTTASVSAAPTTAWVRRRSSRASRTP